MTSVLNDEHRLTLLHIVIIMLNINCSSLSFVEFISFIRKDTKDYLYNNNISHTSISLEQWQQK